MQCEAVIVSRTKAVMHIRSIRLSTVVVAASGNCGDIQASLLLCLMCVCSGGDTVCRLCTALAGGLVQTWMPTPPDPSRVETPAAGGRKSGDCSTQRSYIRGYISLRLESLVIVTLFCGCSRKDSW